MKKFINKLISLHFAQTYTLLGIIMVYLTVSHGLPMVYDMPWGKWVGGALFGILFAFWSADLDGLLFSKGKYDNGVHWYRGLIRILVFVALPVIIHWPEIGHLHWVDVIKHIVTLSIWNAVWFGVFFDPILNKERGLPIWKSGSQDLYTRVVKAIIRRKYKTEAAKVQLALEVALIPLSLLAYYYGKLFYICFGLFAFIFVLSVLAVISSLFFKIFKK